MIVLYRSSTSPWHCGDIRKSDDAHFNSANVDRIGLWTRHDFCMIILCTIASIDHFYRIRRYSDFNMKIKRNHFFELKAGPVSCSSSAKSPVGYMSTGTLTTHNHHSYIKNRIIQPPLRPQCHQIPRRSSTYPFGCPLSFDTLLKNLKDSRLLPTLRHYPCQNLGSRPLFSCDFWACRLHHQVYMEVLRSSNHASSTSHT